MLFHTTKRCKQKSVNPILILSSFNLLSKHRWKSSHNFPRDKDYDSGGKNSWPGEEVCEGLKKIKK